MKQPSITTLYILVSLASKPRHGYDIMQAVEAETNGETRMGPGTLYGAIKRLLDEGLIEQSSQEVDPELDDERRNYYQLTSKGRSLLLSETEKMERLVGQAKHALNHTGAMVWATTA
jgi:DNA-binding PadR family transcriptional regulator